MANLLRGLTDMLRLGMTFAVVYDNGEGPWGWAYAAAVKAKRAAGLFLLLGGLGSAFVEARGAATAAEVGSESIGTESIASKGIRTIDPNEVRFSQNSISPSFKGGGSVDNLAEGLRNGTTNPKDVPPIRLVEREGQLYTLDNRRLEAFRQANVGVPYRMATAEEAAKEGWKFTTTNQGTSIRVRR